MVMHRTLVGWLVPTPDAAWFCFHGPWVMECAYNAYIYIYSHTVNLHWIYIYICSLYNVNVHWDMLQNMCLPTATMSYDSRDGWPFHDFPGWQLWQLDYFDQGCCPYSLSGACQIRMNHKNIRLVLLQTKRPSYLQKLEINPKDLQLPRTWFLISLPRPRSNWCEVCVFFVTWHLSSVYLYDKKWWQEEKQSQQRECMQVRKGHHWKKTKKRTRPDCFFWRGLHPRKLLGDFREVVSRPGCRNFRKV